MNWRKPATLLLTVAITAYLLHKVYSEASRVNLSASSLLSPYFLTAVLTGFVAYLLYTALWYIYVHHASGVSFRRTLLATLSGTYLGFSLNSAVGVLVKVRLLGTDYWYTMGVSLLAIATEFLAGLLLIAFIGKNLIALILAGALLVAVIFDRVAYYLLYPFFWAIRKLQTLEKMYSGWHRARGELKTVLLAIAVGILLTIANSTALYLTARTFGVGENYLKFLEAVLYSNFLGGLLGTPGGIGANELGVTLAIGDTPTAIVVAFLYKFITQYAYAIVGAVAFYHLVAGEVKAN
ncbi:lysylphosphatidylglycerol synthase domain-containing protein [Thermococcus sp.]|uniref:lysylphosphatidylglycerol synthase domain-containing protein n=1 Tax=Thermococcus sp. TaxID=35749 RepID=UPI0026024479|nr:lysylphosphatidylglycerol synthase domain-containing protein [Thermococcus sp.]